MQQVASILSAIPRIEISATLRLPWTCTVYTMKLARKTHERHLARLVAKPNLAALLLSELLLLRVLLLTLLAAEVTAPASGPLG